MNDFKPLSDLVFNVTDKVAGKKDSAKPYVGLEHMPSGGSSLLGFGRASDSISTNNVFRPGDTLFGKLRPQLRKSVQVSLDGYCSTDILVLRASTGANADFAAKIIQSEAVFAQAIRTEEGTKMPRTSWRAIKDVPVLSPPLSQQCKIARILTTVDNLIEQTEALIAKYHAIKLGMMHDLFTRGVDEHGHLRPSYEEAPELYKQSELGWIPREWEVDLVENVLERIIDYRGKTPTKTDSGIPLITAKNVRMGFIDDEPAEFIGEHNFESWMTRGIPVKGDVLFTTEAPLGNVAQIMTDGRLAFAQRIIILQANKRLHNAFLKYLLMTDSPQRWIRTKGTGSTVEGIKQSVFRRLPVAFPKRVDEQIAIVMRLDSLARQSEIEQEALRKFQLNKTGLMQDLLTGTVRVKVDEAEEFPHV